MYKDKRKIYLNRRFSSSDGDYQRKNPYICFYKIHLRPPGLWSTPLLGTFAIYETCIDGTSKVWIGLSKQSSEESFTTGKRTESPKSRGLSWISLPCTETINLQQLLRLEGHESRMFFTRPRHDNMFGETANGKRIRGKLKCHSKGNSRKHH